MKKIFTVSSKMTSLCLKSIASQPERFIRPRPEHGFDDCRPFVALLSVLDERGLERLTES